MHSCAQRRGVGWTNSSVQQRICGSFGILKAATAEAKRVQLDAEPRRGLQGNGSHVERERASLQWWVEGVKRCTAILEWGCEPTKSKRKLEWTCFFASPFFVQHQPNKLSLTAMHEHNLDKNCRRLAKVLQLCLDLNMTGSATHPWQC